MVEAFWMSKSVELSSLQLHFFSFENKKQSHDIKSGEYEG